MPPFYVLPWYHSSIEWYYGNGQVGDFQYRSCFAGWLFWQWHWISRV